MRELDYTDAAKELGCEVAVIKAVASVESNGQAFFPNGQPKVLFEAHVFSRLTKGQYDKTHPSLSSPKWDRSLYLGGEQEHFRVQEAAGLDRSAALMATSWGKFQIMGENYRECGFTSLQDFINAMYHGEAGQLKAFVGFLKHTGLARTLQKRDFTEFARRYNGPGYKRNKYDERMLAAYKSFLH